MLKIGVDNPYDFPIGLDGIRKATIEIDKYLVDIDLRMAEFRGRITHLEKQNKYLKRRINQLTKHST